MLGERKQDYLLSEAGQIGTEKIDKTEKSKEEHRSQQFDDQTKRSGKNICGQQSITPSLIKTKEAGDRKESKIDESNFPSQIQQNQRKRKKY